ncbi:MAG: DNA/RNA non-specific endonuclease [Kiritimatiellae bacterium]|nr:DNA/RNA non-specific endonuclease [Kiritimatiellia bacterium]
MRFARFPFRRFLSPRWWMRSLLRRPFSSLGTILLALLVGSNWFVHRSHAQRENFRVRNPRLSSFLQLWGNATADLTDAWGLTGHDAISSPARPLATNSFQEVGFPTTQKGNRNAPQDLVTLHKKGFTIGYSPSLRRPVWVAYRSFPYQTAATNPENRPKGFRSDPDAPNCPRPSDYTRSGYDRGHMAPNLAIASRFGQSAQEDTFLLSNICPQRPGLNQGPWYEMEYRIAEIWPECHGTIWVIVGAIPSPRKKLKGIDVPAGFYQVLLCQKQDGTLQALAVSMPQTASRHTYARSFLISIRELENRCGLNFFPNLPVKIQQDLETTEATRLWRTGFSGIFRVISERYRSYSHR